MSSARRRRDSAPTDYPDTDRQTCSRSGVRRRGGNIAGAIDYAVVDDSLSETSPLDDAIETFIRREDAERFIEEVRGDDLEIPAKAVPD